MSSPADSVPVAVLVLAWDETTPAVRALVEATEVAESVLDSVVVLVPAGPATDELTPEEFLPLADSILPEELSVLLAPAEALPPDGPPTAPALPAATSGAAPASTPATPPPAEKTPPTPPARALEVALDQVALGAEEVFPSAFAPLPAGLPAPEAFMAEPPSGPAVRILRLSEYDLVSLAEYTQQTLPANAWQGTTSVPAVPYVGSAAAALPAASLPSSAADALAPTFALANNQLAAAKNVSLALPAGVAAAGYLPVEAPAAPDAEPDATPTPVAEELAPTASASTTELSEEVAEELAESFTVEATPAQAGWPQALASLQVPVAVAGAKAPTAAVAQPLLAGAPEFTAPTLLATEEDASLPAQVALLPRASQFDAPNLNFQIIQYARFAVPLALAESPFDVIYAPAWPTWLAAQELRQRTGLPLVLHIAALAAAEEPIDLAAGWPAEIQRQALHRADLILTETPALAHRLRRELDLPIHRVRAVPAADANAVAHALSTVQVR